MTPGKAQRQPEVRSIERVTLALRRTTLNTGPGVAKAREVLQPIASQPEAYTHDCSNFQHRACDYGAVYGSEN